MNIIHSINGKLLIWRTNSGSRKQVTSLELKQLEATEVQSMFLPTDTPGEKAEVKQKSHKSRVKFHKLYNS
jgi:hypothetical protein